MKRKYWILGLFALAALTQLFLPFKLVTKQSVEVLSGNEFKFLIRHNRPMTDFGEGYGFVGSSLQGKYIWLIFEQNRYRVNDPKLFEPVSSVYVSFGKDSLGYARIDTITIKKPENTRDYVLARIFYDRKDSTTLVLNYPFRSYYIEDKDTRDIAKALSAKLRDSTTVNFLAVKIRDSQYLSTELVIDSLSFKEFARKVRENK